MQGHSRRLLFGVALFCALGCFDLRESLAEERNEPPQRAERVQAEPRPEPEPEERLADPGAPPEPVQLCQLERDPDAPPPTFALQFGDEVSPLPLVSAFVMPGERLEIEAVLTDSEGLFRVNTDGGSLEWLTPRSWVWTAPADPGAHCIEVRDENAGEAVRLRAFVLTPYDGSDTLNGYRIGRYEPVPLRGDPAYRVPRGFVEVNEQTRELWVSPHFQLHQFVCKQEADDPAYLLLTTRLLLKLELLLGAFRERGIDAETLFVMSGYRTPYYNRLIGNPTPYSRHAYGDAADVFVDRDRDGVMDDLDGDGSVGLSDARVLHAIVDSLQDETWYRPFVGGLGLYGPKPHRGPFVHVDTRGRSARW